VKPPPDDPDFDLVIGVGFAIAIVLGFVSTADIMSHWVLAGGAAGAFIIVFTIAQGWND